MPLPRWLARRLRGSPDARTMVTGSVGTLANIGFVSGDVVFNDRNAVVSVLNPLLERLERIADSEGDAKAFSTLVEPLFQDLLLIHTNYLEMFTRVRELLTDLRGHGKETTLQVKAAADYLRAKRRDFEPVRVKVRALSAGMAKAALPASVAGFVGAVIVYFPNGQLFHITTASTELLDRIDYWTDGPMSSGAIQELSHNGPGGLCVYVDCKINGLRDHWVKVCTAYAEGKLKLIEKNQTGGVK